MQQDMFAVVYREYALTAPQVHTFTSHEAAQRYYVALVLSLVANYCNMQGTYDGTGRDEIQLGIDMSRAMTTEERSQVVDNANTLFNDWFPDDELFFVRVTQHGDTV